MVPGIQVLIPDRHRRLRRWLKAALLLCLALLLYGAYLGRQVAKQAGVDETRPADVIVIFGAAEYAGRPSPVFRARLDHGYNLFRRGVAGVIIATGGRGEDPNFSEGAVGRDYLIARGVPDRSIIAETQSENTEASARRVAAIMKTNGMRSCIAVSDAYHIFRIKSMLERQGVAVYGAPRPQSKPLSRRQRSKLILHEVVSYMLWKLRIA